MESSNIGFTQVDVRKSEFIWKINKFSSLSYLMKEPGVKLESPIFTTKPNDDIKWQLFLWPNGSNETWYDFLSASLNNTAYNDSNLHLQFALSILDKKGSKRFERIKNFSDWRSYDGFNDFAQKNILLSRADDLLSSDVLTICCELTMTYKDCVKDISQSIQQLSVNLNNKILSAFEQQLEKQEFCDVTLVSSCGKELRAHKFILAARSPVFSAMFTNDMKERNDHTVVIQDLDYNTLKEMLRFMYAGRVEDLDKSIGGVLAAQEKYQIDGLKAYCEEYLFHIINIEKVVEVLALSIRYNIDKIRLLSTKFIQCHGKCIAETAAFKAIDEPNLLTEIVRILTHT